jgi:hypothetical protein
MSRHRAKQLLGAWESEPVDMGGMNEQVLVFMANGEGTFFEFGMGYAYSMPLKWSLKKNVLTVLLKKKPFIEHEITISDAPVEIRDIANNTHRFIKMDVVDSTWYKTSDDPEEATNEFRLMELLTDQDEEDID